jgi:hypothetical protein
MWKCFAKIVGQASLIAIIMQFSGCTSYYLQKVNTSFCAPNGSPDAVVKRDAGDTRLSVGLSVNPKSELKFNDGNHSSIRVNDSYLDDKKYEGENVEVNFPQLQGSLLLDYSILKHLFVFGKGNFGYADDKYSVAINAGVGVHFGVSKISISGYLMPGFYRLSSEAQILRTNSSDTTYINSNDNTYEFSMGGGFKFTTADTTQKMHISWGLDAQLQKYFTFSYTDPTSYVVNQEDNDDNKETYNYRMLFLTPSIGVLRAFGNSQLNVVLNVGFPIVMGGIDNDNELIADEIFPTITFAYSYCFKRKK